MEVKGWKYYNHAAIPTTEPQEEVDMDAIENGHVWKIGGGYAAPGTLDHRL